MSRKEALNKKEFKDIKGNSLNKLNEGILCYVVLRPYKGKGSPKVILHEAEICSYKSYAYGHKGHFVLNPKSVKK